MPSRHHGLAILGLVAAASLRPGIGVSSEPFPGLTPEAALSEGLAGCQATLRGSDAETVFAGLAPLESPAPVVRENESFAVNDMVDFFGEAAPVRSGVAPLSGLVAIVSMDGARCQIISLGDETMADAARTALGGEERGWSWTGARSARNAQGASVDILVRSEGPRSVAHVSIRFRRGPDGPGSDPSD